MNCWSNICVLLVLQLGNSCYDGKETKSTEETALLTHCRYRIRSNLLEKNLVKREGKYKVVWKQEGSEWKIYRDWGL